MIFRMKKFLKICFRSREKRMRDTFGKIIRFTKENFENRIHRYNNRKRYLSTAFWCLKRNVIIERYVSSLMLTPIYLIPQVFDR